MRYSILIVLLIYASSLSLEAQDKWTLDDCIAYALDNNIALKRQELTTEQYMADVKERKANLLPNLNFQSQANMNFGRSVNPVTNEITFSQNLLNSYYLGSRLTVFNGFTNVNRLAAAKFLHQMGVELQQVQVDLTTLDIINAYYNVLMYRGVVKTATDQLSVSKEQLHRIDVLVETGGESMTTKLEIQSQVSNDKLLLTQAVNSEILALESLKQLLQFERSTDFDISENSLLLDLTYDMTVDSDSIYAIALEIMPAINALEYQTTARKKELSASIGEASPEISLSGGWSTGFYDDMREGVERTPFFEQLENNNNQSVTAVIAIPIFNRWFYGRNIKRAKLNLQDSEFQLQQEKNTLYSQVTNATLELAAIKDEHAAAMDSQQYSDLAFTAVEKKFQTGLANATEFSEARRQKFYSEVNLLTTKLQYKLKLMTLGYYMTGKWTD